MLDPPDLPPDHIVATVRQHYGLHLTGVHFLPLGHDVWSWAFRAMTADAPYFLKLRQGVVREATLRVPRYLVDQGVSHIVAPLPTRDQRLWVAVDGFTLALYPFIDGATAMAHGLQERHWATYGAALRAMHDTPLAPDLAPVVPRESFISAVGDAAVPKTWVWRAGLPAQWPCAASGDAPASRPPATFWANPGDAVRALDAHIDAQTFTDPIARHLAAWWQRRRAEIQALVERFEALGQQLRAARPPLVLCHADVHPNNVLIDRDDRLWIVDWDDTMLAPKECDLMMGVGGLGNYPAGPRETGWFLSGYGSTEVDPVALAYYRHVRALGDIYANGEQVLLPGASEAIKRDGLRRMELLFAPGYIVSLVRQGQGDG
ncbi:MAG: phosphotransferase [Chloroflexi bacterium]|nr:phosphotransferase [Chloroflexota bacterium]